MKTYTINGNRLSVEEHTEDGGANNWDLDAATALKMLDMFEDMPAETRAQLEQIATVENTVENQL